MKGRKKKILCISLVGMLLVLLWLTAYGQDKSVKLQGVQTQADMEKLPKTDKIEENEKVEKEEIDGKTKKEIAGGTKTEENGKEAPYYSPITEGWKVSKSAKGNITRTQKADLDSMVKAWKSGIYTDEGVKAEIENYLTQEEITYLEVSVTCQGYSLCEQIPDIELKNGGNVYSFLGIYSTGKQNPDGTDKTVCYQWSVFVF